MNKAQNKTFGYTFDKTTKMFTLDIENKASKLQILWGDHKIRKNLPFFPKGTCPNFPCNHLKPPPLKDIFLGLNGTKRKGCVHFCNKAQLTFRSSSVSHWCVHTGAFKNCWQGADTIKCRKYGPIKIWNLSYFFHFTNFLLPFWKGLGH